MISRTTSSAAQNAPTAAAESDSTARHAPSRPSLCRLPYAALVAAPSRRLPRSPCNNVPADIRQEACSISGDRSWRCDLRQHRRPLVWSGDTVRSKSTVFWLSSAQMTRVHPIPAPGLRLPPASLQVRASVLPFFYPRRDGVAREAEGAREAA